MRAEFFRASAEPNLSAASRLLGKNRSSALRAYRELQGRFSKEMKRILGWGVPLDGAAPERLACILHDSRGETALRQTNLER